MKLKVRFLSAVTAGLFILGFGMSAFAQVGNSDKQSESKNVTVKVYYFHTSARCANCKKFEKWSKEIVDEKFKTELESGQVVYEKYNLEELSSLHS